MARQPRGQHFLWSAAWRAKICAAMALAAPGPAEKSREKDCWVEIGAGHGEMTEHLAQSARGVLAIESDAHLVQELRRRALAGVEVIQADFLSVDLAAIAPSPSRVYGNLPYYITSPILHHLFRAADRIQDAYLVMQQEVAERIVAPPHSRAFGYLSVACQFYFTPEIRLLIPPGAFRPPPKVSSALLRLVLPGARAHLGILREAEFLGFVQKCFAHKRKTLRNNLRPALPVERIGDWLAAQKLHPKSRAEELNLRQFADLFRAVKDQL